MKDAVPCRWLLTCNFNRLKPKTYFTPSADVFINSVFCPQCFYVFCVDLRTNSDYFLYSVNLSVFKTEAKSVYCAVRNGSLNQTDTVSYLKG